MFYVRDVFLNYLLSAAFLARLCFGSTLLFLRTCVLRYNFLFFSFLFFSFLFFSFLFVAVVVVVVVVVIGIVAALCWAC